MQFNGITFDNKGKLVKYIAENYTVNGWVCPLTLGHNFPKVFDTFPALLQHMNEHSDFELRNPSKLEFLDNNYPAGIDTLKGREITSDIVINDHKETSMSELEPLDYATPQEVVSNQSEDDNFICANCKRKDHSKCKAKTCTCFDIEHLDEEAIKMIYKDLNNDDLEIVIPARQKLEEKGITGFTVICAGINCFNLLPAEKPVFICDTCAINNQSPINTP